jgi:putative endonuclease
MPYYVYILASRKNGTLYTGVTNNVVRRIHEHLTGVASEFTRRYGVNILVYVETHDEVEIAIAREKRIKRWRRVWKIELIEENNPDWRDLFDDLM